MFFLLKRIFFYCISVLWKKKKLFVYKQTVRWCKNLVLLGKMRSLFYPVTWMCFTNWWKIVIFLHLFWCCFICQYLSFWRYCFLCSVDTEILTVSSTTTILLCFVNKKCMEIWYCHYPKLFVFVPFIQKYRLGYIIYYLYLCLISCDSFRVNHLHHRAV